MVEETSATTGKLARIRRGLTPGEWRRLLGMAGFIVLLHAVGWFTLVVLVAPQHYSAGSAVFGIGIGVTAYTLGMRHAFDADHIAAIDNTTRKLLAEGGRRPLSVGFWFSLGHSTVVFGLCLLISLGVKALTGQVQDETSVLQSSAGLIGTLVSGCFLLLIAALNIVVLAGVLKVFRRMRRGGYDETELERQLTKRGLVNRFLGRVTRTVRKPVHMYPVGFLFGLGFDTATEVSLLVLAGGAAAVDLPWFAVLTLPVLFAAGMCLLDAIDGVFMNFAYTWAFSKPVRKVYYNITITGLSIAVAVLIGGIELISPLAEKLHWTTGVIGWIGRLDIGDVGFTVVGLFAVVWAVALLIWRFGKIEQKWSGERSPTH
ncbi:high-affinity nickel-transport protein [Amycolatopsis cihanbeyliensis]|uniref:Nickel/cobalt efflux system n=2 Tax=Amycolatopsis cihanbeyliensis TaxID=1128664 RepID=A0A542DC70_AMYCI|nr:high-affinity nickel-transport protein [Amycolatopsis cihanbeyliensis]